MGEAVEFSGEFDPQLYEFEQVIMGYILEYTLAAAGADVRDLTGIVGSRSTREAQLRDQVDVAYEFTGNAWINYLGHEKPIPDMSNSSCM